MKHRLALLHLILLFLLLMAKVSAQSAYVADSLYADSLKQITRHYLEAQRWDSVVKYGSLLFEEAYQQHDWHGNIIEAHVALGIAYAHQGKYELAMRNLGQAHNNATTSHNQQMIHQAFNQIMQIAKEEQQRLVEHRKNIQLLVLGIVALAIICSLFFALYYQKNRLLIALVKRQREALERKSQQERRSQVLADGKKKELIAQLEQLMKEQKAFCENLLTKERVAEMLQTNRTYLSQVINEVYGKSFTQYINDLRIEEALRRLDDPDSRRALRLIGLDLGFNSPTTFNTQFQQRTGMTPAQYRQKVRQLVGTDEADGD
ncbi:MAG: helix-turn-helix domain-containing protein [Bacteroides sp.]